MEQAWRGALLRAMLRRGAAISGVIAMVAAVGQAQDLEANLQAKLARPFVKNAAWVMDYDQALQASRVSQRLLFAYFTRSYQP